MVHSQYQHGPRLFFGEGRFFVVLVLLHANPPDGFCSSLLCRPHLPHGARPVCWLFNLCGGPTSPEDIQHRFPRCRLSATRSLCRLRRQRSLRGRFAPIRRSISILKSKTQMFRSSYYHKADAAFRLKLGPRTSRVCSRKLQFGARTSRICRGVFRHGHRTSRGFLRIYWVTIIFIFGSARLDVLNFLNMYLLEHSSKGDFL